MTNLINDITDIDLSIYNKSFVDKTIAGRMGDTKCYSFVEYTEYLTNNSYETDKLKKSIEAGCNDYIAKPINKTELETLIQKYFGE